MDNKEISEYLELIEELKKEKVGDPKDLNEIKEILEKEKDLDKSDLNYLTELDIKLQRKYDEPLISTKDVTDKKKIDEIVQIEDRLDKDEKVLMVIRQTKNPLKPGSSLITPDTIFATTKKIIIRDPSALGLRQNIETYSYEKIVDVKLEKGMFSSTVAINVPGSIFDGYIQAIPKDDAEELLKIIYERINGKKNSTSDDDPLLILKKRFAKGEITKEEYEEMKSVLE